MLTLLRAAQSLLGKSWQQLHRPVHRQLSALSSLLKRPASFLDHHVLRHMTATQDGPDGASTAPVAVTSYCTLSDCSSLLLG